MQNVFRQIRPIKQVVADCKRLSDRTMLILCWANICVMEENTAQKGRVSIHTMKCAFINCEHNHCNRIAGMWTKQDNILFSNRRIR